MVSEFTAGYSQDAAQEELQKIMDYKEAVQAIKDATGVSDANEIIQKFLTQEDRRRVRSRFHGCRVGDLLSSSTVAPQ